MNDATYQRAIECAAKLTRDECEESPSDVVITLLAATFCRTSEDVGNDVTTLIAEQLASEAEAAAEAAAEAERDDNCGGGVDERGCYCGRCYVSRAEAARRRRGNDEGDAAFDSWRDDRSDP